MNRQSELQKLLLAPISSRLPVHTSVTIMSGPVKCEPPPALRPPSNTNGGCRMSCSFYGCMRSYTDQQTLDSHLKDHQTPTQSLPGKVFLCSLIGCEGSFPSMQGLMEHMRHHHKPNYFFVCESCRAKLRSYRTLLKHLQTCAKVAKSKAAKAGTEPAAAPDANAAAAAPPAPLAADPSASSEPEQMEAEPTPPPSTDTSGFTPEMLPQPCQQAPVSYPLLDTATAGRLPAALAVLEPAVLSAPPQSLPGQAEASYSPFPPHLSPVHPSLPDPALQQQQQQQRAPRASFPGLSTPPPQQTPAGSNAVWRKNQGQSFNSRILWEHTRGRYSCLQCGHCTPNRKEMTAHIKGQHKSPAGKQNSDTDLRVGSPSSQAKTLPSDPELSVYTQL